MSNSIKKILVPFFIPLAIGTFMLQVCSIDAQQCVPDSVVYYETGNIQTFIVPYCVTSITIDARGAQGGGAVGGSGARMVGTFTVTQGERLNILVGGQGNIGGDGGGGGGGSYVVDISNNAWIVAGGGGGEGLGAVVGKPGDTNIFGTSGTSPASSGTGGNNGGGGGGSTDNGSCISSGGGGGYCGNGGEGSNGGSPGTGGNGCFSGTNGTGTLCLTSGGASFLNGGNAGVGCTSGGCTGVNGGYGGGGGTAGGGGGGGGGYSGGGGAGWSNGASAGGGGGSINNGTHQSNTNGFQSGNGKVIIRYCLSGLSTLTTSSGITCFGGANGKATDTAIGGISPFTYSWSPIPGTNASETGLSAGTYTVTITDAQGCSGIDTISITQPPVLLAIMGGTPTSPSCYGGSNGFATVTPVGGTPAYTYSWTPAGGTNLSGTGLAAGTYTVLVTDAHGCSATASINIVQPPMLIATMGAPVNVSCHGGSNGSATVAVSGGTSPYSYSWAPSGGTGATGTGLTSGTYTVKVTDAHGCTATTTAIIGQPPILTAFIAAQTNISCNGVSNGTATATASGGTSPYRYLWFPVASTNETITGLGARSYTVTVTDAHGCAATVSVTITQPAILTASMGAPTQVSCNGGSNGSATLAASGGTLPYTYSWSPILGSNATITGLSIGTYSVKVTDANGCTATATVAITQPPAMTATTSSTPASCNQLIGSATAIPAGGKSPYTYLWSPIGGTYGTATGLSAGTYSVTVTDNNGCTITATAAITQPPTVTVSATATPTSCNIFNGSATAIPVGGTSPYTYSWSPIAGTNALITGLSAGTYTVTVTDNNGCMATATAAVTHPPAVTAVASVLTNVGCNGGNNGSAMLTASGGTSPYTYSWSPNGGTNATASGLTAGTYTITVTDINGCIATAAITITQPPPITAIIGAPTNVLCNGGNNGSATLTASGGTSPYTYSWSPIASTNATITGLRAGIYSVMITDSNGCSATASVTITQPSQLAVIAQSLAAVSCYGGSNGSGICTASGGTPLYTYLWTPSGGTNATATGLSAGTYSVTLTDANGCTATANVLIVQPTLLTATVGAPVNVSCNGGNNGSATLTASGGTPAYTYSWAPTGGTNATAIGLSAGNYTVTLTDANSCNTTATVNITQPSGLSAIASALTNAGCNGGTNGSAMVTASGGVSPYHYSWSPNGGNNDTITGLSVGTYTVSVTDANGCTASATAIISQPNQLSVVSNQLSAVSCYGGSNGSAKLTAGGGTLPYTYSWSPIAGTNATLTGLSAGTYSATVTDANGCISSASVSVMQPLPLAAALTGPQSICSGQSGLLVANVTGGTSPYLYNWSNGATASSVSVAPKVNTTYKCTIIDVNGCADTSSISIELGPALIITINGPNSVCSGNSITLCGNATGGIGNKTYTWQPGNYTTDCITVSPITNTIYSLKVQDDCGADTTVTFPITVVPLPKVNFATDIQKGCSPLCLQFRDLSALAPGKAVAWLWNFGNGDSSNTQNPVYCYPNAGNFSVNLTVFSSGGCSSSLNVMNMITVYSHPLAGFTESPQPTTILAPTIQFTDKSTDRYGIVNWFWSFGDSVGTIPESSLQNPFHTYSDTGTYCPQLVAMNMHGCTDTATNCLIISPVFNLYIPSAFTPNGDGINDVFQAKGSYIKSFEMYIFDRWGMELFYTTDINNGWNGTVKGGSAISQEDTYIYKIYATDSQDNAHTFIGQVNLLK